MTVTARELSVIRVSMDPVAPIRIGSPFIGRSTQLGRLTELVDGSRDGAAAAVLISGDAGVGKTRLADEAIAAASARGQLVLIGHCVDLGAGGLPYLPFVEALSAAVRGQAGASSQQAAEVIRRTVAELPVLGRLTGRVPPGGGTEDGMDRLPLFEAVASLVGALSRDVAPVLLVLEDLHWADPSTRDLLRFLLARLSTDRLLILATYRSDDLHRRHPFRPLVAELVRLPRVERFEVHAFDDAELRQFLLGLNGAPLPDRVIAEIRARSEGNAYYAEELLTSRELGIRGLPLALADVLLARIERLPAAAQHVVRVAAVAGRRVDEALLRTVCGFDPEEAETALREAVTHHVLIPDGEDRLSFRHALLQEAVYGDLLPGERVRLHARYADELKAMGQRASAAELAHHCVASHDLAGALEAYIGAAEDAECRLAPTQALAHYEQALQIWDAVAAEARPGRVNAVDLTLRAARMAGQAGDFERAVSLAREATEAARTLGDDRLEARARARLAQDLYDSERNDEALAEAQRVRDLQAGQPPNWVWVWAATVAARVAATRRDVDAVEAITAEALPVARELGLASAEVDLMISSSFMLLSQGDPAAMAEALAQAHRRATEADEPQSALRAAFNLALLKIDQGDLVTGAADAQAALTGAQQAGLGSSVYGLESRTLMINALEMAGSWDEALEHSRMACLHVPASQHSRFLDVVLPITVSRDPEAGLAATLRDDLQAWPYLGSPHMVFGARADALAWLGRTDEAQAAVEEGLAYLAGMGYPDHLGGLYLGAIGLAALADAAVSARARADPTAEKRARVAGEVLLAHVYQARERGKPRLATLSPEGLAWVARAEVEAARLAGEADPDRWRDVVDAFAGFGHRYETARCRWRLAESLAAAGDRAAAGEQARLARVDADALRARPLREAVDALARRARLDLGTGPVQATVLTPREQEVMRLVADGMTNRQIGRRLQISEKTASVHVSNILTKLGASGRAEAVTIVHRRGLIPDLPAGSARGQPSQAHD